MKENLIKLIISRHYSIKTRFSRV